MGAHIAIIAEAICRAVQDLDPGDGYKFTTIELTGIIDSAHKAITGVNGMTATDAELESAIRRVVGMNERREF